MLQRQLCKRETQGTRMDVAILVFIEQQLLAGVRRGGIMTIKQHVRAISFFLYLEKNETNQKKKGIMTFLG